MRSRPPCLLATRHTPETTSCIPRSAAQSLKTGKAFCIPLETVNYSVGGLCDVKVCCCDMLSSYMSVCTVQGPGPHSSCRRSGHGLPDRELAHSRTPALHGRSGISWPQRQRTRAGRSDLPAAHGLRADEGGQLAWLGGPSAQFLVLLWELRGVLLQAGRLHLLLQACRNVLPQPADSCLLPAFCVYAL